MKQLLIHFHVWDMPDSPPRVVRSLYVPRVGDEVQLDIYMRASVDKVTWCLQPKDPDEPDVVIQVRVDTSEF